MPLAEALVLDQLVFQRPKHRNICFPSYTLEQVSVIADDHHVTPPYVISVILGLFCKETEPEETMDRLGQYTKDSEICHSARIALTEQAEADAIVLADELDITQSEALGSIVFLATQDEAFMERVFEYLKVDP